MMKARHFICSGTLIAFVAFWAACGGGSSSSSEEAGTASVTSLSSIPTMDLSSYDSSTGASANLAALLSTSKGISKGIGEGLRDVGGMSRAGCEANMHKQEVFRMSQQAQLDRCYAEAMETAGLITIPSGSSAIYSLTPPEMTAEEKTGMCEGIPEERLQEKAKCEEGEGPGGKTMSIRIGRFDNELRIDMCSGTELNNEATYTAVGSVYTADVTRKGNWGGSLEGGKFHVVVDLGTGGAVTDGLVTLGTNGLVNAAGQMVGGSGRGTITFERPDSSNKVYGMFIGEFTDPFSDTATSFTGKTYARFSNTGCAKFSFVGVMSAMRVSDMIPFNVSTADQTAFLAQFAAELGISSLTTDSKLCTNQNFDSEDENETDRPMVLLTGETCGEVTHTGVECFGIVNGTTTGNFGEAIVAQTFTVIADSASSFFAEVNAFDLSTLAEPPANIDAITFARNWDCAGPFTAIDFSSVNPTVMETAMQKCKAIEEKARGNNGQGGNNCGQQEQQTGVNSMAEEGGGAVSNGVWGGQLAKNLNGNTCGPNSPDFLFINKVSDKYCIGLAGMCSAPFTGGEGSITVNGAVLNPANGTSITTITYDANPPTSATIVFSVGCQTVYTFNAPAGFGAPAGEFGGEGSGTAPGEAGFIPAPCVAAGLTDPSEANACMQLCSKPENSAGCRL